MTLDMFRGSVHLNYWTRMSRDVSGFSVRPLFHPPISDVTVQGILLALSDPVRARILAELANCEGRNCAAFLNVNRLPLPKSSLSQHFKVLREAGLIRSERNGVELKNFTRCDELKERFGKLIPTILETYRKEGR